MTNEGELEELPSLPAEEGQEHSNAYWETSDEEEPQEALSSPPTCGRGSCDPEAPQMISEEEPEEVLKQLLCDGEVSGKVETLQMNREEESEELISSLLTYDGQGAELPAYGNQKCSCVMCSSKDVPEGPEASTASSQARDTMDTVDLGNNSSSGKLKRKRSKSA
ncbi:nuclear body protein SP140-like isoform X3 [Leptonychotes weddellii]|uniref:Nuclear body protein SP140-like isoform X3 n=1 Tax=Leptonychotes weddellii TaxID=9713 RepID=A0A7F8RE77_LEPWE|nr:nuclear body protein SP140-like isoform X3 [Leptonychotes weddellii]